MPAHVVMERKGDFVRVRRAPGDDTFEFGGVVWDCTDLHQLGFNGLGVSHNVFRMARMAVVLRGDSSDSEE